ncbi:MAG: gamma-glutamylcyclotransferase family protein [Planctomycetota bacterium]|jgi:gamma-glutamylcyclotransferase (GGCT)/AIG2-like uncharacterized protein YtfP
MSENSEFVFVYGLLRSGESLHHILEELPLRGPFQLDGFALYDLGKYPGAVHADGTIVGELCELPHPAVLAALDEAEGVHGEPPLYLREQVEVDGQAAWIYVYDRPVGDAPRIRSGDWLKR